MLENVLSLVKGQKWGWRGFWRHQGKGVYISSPGGFKKLKFRTFQRKPNALSEPTPGSHVKRASEAKQRQARVPPRQTKGWRTNQSFQQTQAGLAGGNGNSPGCRVDGMARADVVCDGDVVLFIPGHLSWKGVRQTQRCAQLFEG